jgi:hypothetical protein
MNDGEQISGEFFFGAKRLFFENQESASVD